MLEFDAESWMTLKVLKQNFAYYKSHPELGKSGYEKEKRIFSNIARKFLTSN